MAGVVRVEAAKLREPHGDALHNDELDHGVAAAFDEGRPCVAYLGRQPGRRIAQGPHDTALTDRADGPMLNSMAG